MRWGVNEDHQTAVVPLLHPLQPGIGSFDGRVATFSLATVPHRCEVPSPKPSWHSMLLTQPPIRKITMLNKDSENYQHSQTHDLSVMTPFTWRKEHPRHTHITNEAGITFGDILAHLEEKHISGSFDIMFEPVAPISGSYWRRVTGKSISAASLPAYLRRYSWSSEGESPVGWNPTEDCVDHLGGPLDGTDDSRRSDEADAGYYRELARGRDGIGTIKGRPIFGSVAPPAT